MRMPWKKRAIAEYSNVSISRDELRRRSRLLIIDDERPDLIDDLQKSGFAVDYFSDVDGSKLSVLDQPLYDLILLDFGGIGTKVGQEQGLTVLRHIKRTNPATVVLAYTAKALSADQADFYRIADGVLAKDAGVADSMEKIELGLRKAHSLENVWRGLLSLGGVNPGSDLDRTWQDLAVRAIEKPKELRSFRERVTSNLSGATSRVAFILIEKVVELGVKAVMGAT